MSSLAQPLDAGVKLNLFVLLKFNTRRGNYISKLADACFLCKQVLQWLSL